MSKFCSNCGNKLDEKAVICVKCGVATCNLQQVKTKQPGRGLSIASMVLGIIAIFYGTCFSLTSIMMNLIDEIYNKEEIIFSIGFNFWPLVLSITKILSKCSYEIFLVQMVAIPFLPPLSFVHDELLQHVLKIIFIFIISIIGGFYFNKCYNILLKNI